jgi:hypothetical protein
MYGTILTFPGGTGETTKNLSHDSRFPDRDLNQEPDEYEARVLNSQLQRFQFIIHLSLFHSKVYSLCYWEIFVK